MEQSMDEWLAAQAEIRQAGIVSCKSAITISPPLYFTTRRCTYSDVVSIVTTTRPTSKADGRPQKKYFLPSTYPSNSNLDVSSHRLRLPFKEPMYASPLRSAADLENQEHARRSKALLKEQKLFMSKLKAKRDRRFELENWAAPLIQGRFRGHSLRKHWGSIKKRTEIGNQIRNNMKDIAKDDNLITAERDIRIKMTRANGNAAERVQARYRGVLGRRTAAKERLLLNGEKEYDAATAIACMARKKQSLKTAQQVQERFHEEAWLIASIMIQKIYRGHLGRRRYQGERWRFETICTLLIQRAHRRYLARKVLQKERVHVREETTTLAAIQIQQIGRGKNSRARVARLRQIEKEKERDACARSIERTFRGGLGRRIFAHEQMRRREEDRLWAVLRIQRVGRGYMGRRVFTEAEEAAKEDIFAQTRKGDDQKVDDLFAGFGTDKKHTVSDVDHNGSTVLLIACQFGHRKIARKSLRWGMDIDHLNDQNCSAVQVAVRNGHGKLAEYLITKKAEVGFFGRTLLHDAARHGLLGVCQALLLRGINVNEQDPNGDTPLHDAAAGAGSVEVAALLLEKGASVYLLNSKNESPLHVAAGAGNGQLAQRLMEEGADATATDKGGKRPWEWAQGGGHEELGELLKQQCEAEEAAKATAAAAEEEEEERGEGQEGGEGVGGAAAGEEAPVTTDAGASESGAVVVEQTTTTTESQSADAGVAVAKTAAVTTVTETVTVHETVTTATDSGGTGAVSVSSTAEVVEEKPVGEPNGAA